LIQPERIDKSKSEKTGEKKNSLKDSLEKNNTMVKESEAAGS